MDKPQAAEIQRLLLAVSDAVHEARAAIFELALEDRAMFARPLGEFASCLHFEMLAAIYARYPELRPPEEPPTIISDLRWEDVTLPASVSEADLDAVIFSMLTPRFQKTAMVIAKAMERCDECTLPVNGEILGARIQALAESDRLKSVGDLRQWRHSEVRLQD